MFIFHLLRNSHLRTMTFCFIYFSFIFGISCKDLTTQQSYSSSTTSTRASTIAPSWTTQSSSTQYSVPIPITRTFPSSSTTTSLQHSNICAIKFYTENNHDGETLEIDSPNGVSNLHMNEQSAQTFGTCCWKIYR